MNILLLHGIQGYAGIHWQQWLKTELEDAGHSVTMPPLPDTDHPNRQTWLQAVIHHMAGLPPKNTVIVAHSLGVVSALDYLEQTTKPIKGLVSVSGFARPLGTELNEYFMQEKSIDFTKVLPNIQTAKVLFGDDDPYVSQSALNELTLELTTQPSIIKGGGHLNTASGFTTFPLLLNIVLALDNSSQRSSN